MEFLVKLIVIILAMIFGGLFWHMFFTYKKNAQVVGDLHIFPNEDGETVCYVAWETNPEFLMTQHYVLLKVIHKPDSQK